MPDQNHTVTCAHCHTPLSEGAYRPAYASLRADAGPLLCLRCDAAAWARINAIAATQPATAPFSNAWD